MADEAHDLDWSAEVWADEWNPEPNVWAPSQEPYPAYGLDASQVEYQEHTDLHTTEPMPEQYGHEPSGTVPPVGLNLLTDVRKTGTVPPPMQIVQHEVHTTETGSEVVRVRQAVVTSAVTPLNLLEENPDRKRALLRFVPSTPVAGGVNRTAGQFTGFPVTITVPAGQVWSPTEIGFHYTADGVAGNRQIRVRIIDNLGNLLYSFVDSTALTAGQDAQVSLAPGNPTQHILQSGTTFSVQGNLPSGMVLQPGATIVFDALNSDPGDSISGGVIFFTQSGTGNTAVYIAPRDEGGGSAQAQSWFKLVSGDPPIELKTQSGIDVILESAGSATLQVYEELVRTDRQPLTGIV
jgi:hypothetical protein